MFDVIERLKSEWTDRYVVVDAAVPELTRFGQATGLVRTVNMNGRCLVEFDQFNNTAWYDIDPSYLTVVPKPEPKPAGEKPAKAAPAKPAASCQDRQAINCRYPRCGSRQKGCRETCGEARRWPALHCRYSRNGPREGRCFAARGCPGGRSSRR